MNYEILSDLDDYQVLEGMTAYFDNAKDLFETGENLAIQQKYGIATALTIISIEELIKSHSTFLVYTGVKDEDIVDLTFKGGNIHKKRLKIAFANSALMDLFNEVNLENILNKVIKIKHIDTDRDIKNFDQLMEWIEDFVSIIGPDIVDELSQKHESVEAKLENQLNDHSNWFLHAQKIKEKGIYVDFISSKWSTPQKLNKEVFEKAQSHANEIFVKVGNPIKRVIDSGERERRVLRHLFQLIMGIK